MNRKIFLLWLMLNVMSKYFICCRRTRKGKDHPAQQKEDYFERINICSIESNSEAINCFCNQNTPLQATEATCLIFGTLNRTDSEPWSRFKTQPNLTRLTLTMRSTETFTFIPSHIFAILKRLNNFDLKYASISSIESYAFGNLSSLTQLHLSRNKITILASYSFAHLVNLLEINLEENQLIEIKRNAFYELPRLRKLFLGNNNISRISDGAFKYLGSLLELELKHNNLKSVSRDCFLGLSNLVQLDLSSNLLTSLSDLTFAELWHLEELQLDSNQLDIVNRKTFYGLNHLKRLTMSENNLVTLDSRQFEDTLAIHYLDLRENNLITLTFDNMRPIFSNFLNDSSYLFIEKNRLECDCKLLWIFDLHNETRNKNIRNSLEKLTCFSKSNEDGSLSMTPVPAIPNNIYDEYDGSEDSYEYDDDGNDSGVDDINVSVPMQNNQKKSENKKFSNLKKHFLFQIGREQLTCKPIIRPLNDVDSNQIAIEQQQSLSGVSRLFNFQLYFFFIVPFFVFI